MPTLVRRIQSLLALNWHTHVCHTMRKGNMSAYWLANYSLSMSSINFYIIDYPLNELHGLICKDLFGDFLS